MKRVLMVVAVATGVLGVGAWSADSARTPDVPAVTSLSVAPAAGRPEVLIGFNGAVTVHDFALRAPDRIVIDLTGATLGVKKTGYDHVARGGIVDVSYS